MAKSVAHGTDIKWNSVTITNAASVSTSHTTDTTNVTDLASTAQEYLALLTDSGSCEVAGFFDPDEAEIASLFADKAAGTSRTLLITFPTGQGGTLSGTAFCTSLTISAAEGDAMRFTASFKYTGALTLTPA